MKDPKKLTPKQKERKERKAHKRIIQAAKNALTWKKRGRYAKRREKWPLK